MAQKNILEFKMTSNYLKSVRLLVAVGWLKIQQRTQTAVTVDFALKKQSGNWQGEPVAAGLIAEPNQLTSRTGFAAAVATKEKGGDLEEASFPKLS